MLMRVGLRPLSLAYSLPLSRAWLTWSASCWRQCSRANAESRVAAWPETDVYLMEIGNRRSPRGGFAIDALHARNVSAFANFGCLPNMRKWPVFVQHWDRRLPHAAFFATKDIPPGEELTYRRDESATSEAKCRVSRVPCLCGHAECRKWV